MSDVEKRFHESWLGMVQPIEGLVVSVPVLVEAQCMARQTPELQQRLVEHCPPAREGAAGPEGRAIRDLDAFLAEILGLSSDLLDREDALPEELCHYVPEGQQTIRPTLGIRKLEPPSEPEGSDSTPASRAGARYVALLWDVSEPGGVGLDLDKPETKTGPWEYPPSAKFDRLLRHCRVPIGILTNREVVRLVYAPHGESSGHITFRIDDMASVGGRPILDAFVMLLSATRFFGVAEEHALPALLAESRKRQANVTNELAQQVFDALQILLRGFENAAERDGRDILDDALAREGDHLYKGLLTVLLRLVFTLYAEDRGLLPVDRPLYAEHLSVLGLFERLEAEHGAFPDSMSRRFGAWGQLLATFRAIFLGVEHGDFRMPPRRGRLFDPNVYPFLEGWGPAGAAPIVIAEHRAEVKVPTVDDETVFRVLEKLVVFEGQRLSYRTLDVEQIGSVYEALMGYHVERIPAPAVCMRPDGIWVTAADVLEVPAARRAKWLKDTVGLSKAQSEKLATALEEATGPSEIIDALSELAITGRKRDRSLAIAKAGQLVLQPGAERRRTSSHYTPRSLSAPIVKRTIEPLLACMGETPPSDLILQLKICDPAMGSGAFLVEACRFLADQLVAAWTREGKLGGASPLPLAGGGQGEGALALLGEDPVLHARRLVAQRCLYGVDKNDSAVELAKLSLWLVTLARDLPFTFLDHALRHGDSLVGLSFDQIKSFHWKPGKQLHLAETVLKEALDEAIAIRQRILDLATDPSPAAQREKERLVADAEDACARARLIGDVVVGAFFAEAKDKAREKERERRLGLVQRWLDGDEEAGAALSQMQAEIRARLPVFHWMLEFPEVFYAERPDPLEAGRVNRAAFMDGFVGNPPFAGKNALAESLGPALASYPDWLQSLHEGAHGNADLSAHFFRRAAAMIGVHGTISFIATSTIAQGDTRSTGLAYMLLRGFEIYEATTRLPWEGGPNVAVAVLHLALGAPMRAAVPRRLDGVHVPSISSRLKPTAEREEPAKLCSNASRCFQGSIILGTGFMLTDLQRAQLIEANPNNAERIFPCLGGEEMIESPTHAHQRFVINFGELTLEQAAAWPDLLSIIRRDVKPERDRNKRANYRDRWWQFAELRPGLYGALAGVRRCLITVRVQKHNAFTFADPRQVFSNTIYVLPVECATCFAVLQTRVHAAWVRLLSSTLEDRAATFRVVYSASDCFETFPFPHPDPRAVIPALEAIGQRLYDSRAAYMIETQQGLTQTYNRLKDPSCHDVPIEHLRRLHEEMDRAVLDAYGWTDIVVPPYCPTTSAEQKALEAFQDEVIDRLFVLNAERAEDERRRGLGGKKPGKPKSTRGKKKAKADDQRALDLGESE